MAGSFHLKSASFLIYLFGVSFLFSFPMGACSSQAPTHSSPIAATSIALNPAAPTSPVGVQAPGIDPTGTGIFYYLSVNAEANTLNSSTDANQDPSLAKVQVKVSGWLMCYNQGSTAPCMTGQYLKLIDIHQMQYVVDVLKDFEGKAGYFEVSFETTQKSYDERMQNPASWEFYKLANKDFDTINKVSGSSLSPGKKHSCNLYYSPSCFTVSWLQIGALWPGQKIEDIKLTSQLDHNSPNKMPKVEQEVSTDAFKPPELQTPPLF